MANPLRVDDPDAVRQRLETVAAEHGHRLLWLETTEEDPGHGQALQAVQQGAGLVCALGGDGTTRSVAAALAGTEVPLGLLPGGTGNLLARNLGLPLDGIEAAFVAALERGTRRIDVGRVRLDGGEPDIFLVMCGVGMDAGALDETPDAAKKALGWPSYLIGGLRQLARPGIAVRVRGAEPFSQHVRSVLVGNCGTLQGGVALMPEASPDDGRLDLLAFAPEGAAGWVRVLAAIVTGRRRGNRALREQHGTHFTISTRRPAPMELDGDPVGDHRVMRAEVWPGALLVRA